MRHNDKKNAICKECGDTQDKALNMFDVKIGNEVITLCDKCNEELFYKSLAASCQVNARVKSKRDMAIIRERSEAKFKTKEMKTNK